MTTTLHTEFSVYEIDQADKRIRRMTSTHGATPNQPGDGEWRSYEKLHWSRQRLLVSYGMDDQMIYRQTLLSEAQQIDGDPIEAPDVITIDVQPTE